MFGWLFGWLWEKSVRGDVVLITGGAMGIGRLLALKFAALGATVVIWDLHEDLGDQVVAEIEALPSATPATATTSNKRAYFYRVDVTDREKVYATGAEVLAQLGRVDILINNAGIVGGKPILESSDRMIERTMAVNATSHFWTIKAFLPGMLQRNKGHIVSLASAAGIFGSPGMVDYGASKFAAVGLMMSLRQELHAMGRPNIQTTLICPSFIDTGMFEGVSTPLFTSLLSPEFVADSIVRSVRRNHFRLLTPAVLVLLELVIKIAPTWFIDLYMRVTKSNRTMHTFKQTRPHAIKEE
jgi:all-trans-retinol dehydrogenase (NAD+)